MGVAARCLVSVSPAPGYRSSASGALYYIGSNGYGWSSTVCDTLGMNFCFAVTWLDLSGTNHRGYGFQLRCLSE